MSLPAHLTARAVAARYTGAELIPLGHHEECGVTVMAARVRSGLVVPVTVRGVVHRVAAAVIVNDEDTSFLASRYMCGGGSFRTVGVTEEQAAELRICDNCTTAASAPLGPVVYRCFDAAGRLIYIGSTINVGGRFGSHRAITPWWEDVARFEFESFESETAARWAESRAIFQEHPLHNKTGRAVG